MSSTPIAMVYAVEINNVEMEFASPFLGVPANTIIIAVKINSVIQKGLVIPIIYLAIQEKNVFVPLIIATAKKSYASKTQVYVAYQKYVAGNLEFVYNHLFASEKVIVVIVAVIC